MYSRIKSNLEKYHGEIFNGSIEKNNNNNNINTRCKKRCGGNVFQKLADKMPLSKRLLT